MNFTVRTQLLLLFLHCILSVAFTSGIVTAEEQPLYVYELEEISVTASRLERDSAEIPASISIAGQDKIEDAGMFNIREALVGIPGVLIETRNQGYDTRIILRGAGLKANYGVREVMFLLDGVPITDPDGLTRLDIIDTHSIKQIEVVKGPNATLWGANAAGGVINVITKSPFEEQGGFLKLGVGNHKTRYGYLSWTDGIQDNLYYRFSLGRRQSDNSWRRWNEFETTQASLQTALILDDCTTLESTLSYTDANSQLPGKLNQEMYDRYLNTGKANETDGPWKYSGRYSKVLFFSSKFTKAFHDFNVKPMFFVNKWSHEHPVTGRINEADTCTYGADVQADYRHKIGEMGGILTFGATARIDDQETDYFKYAEYDTGFNGRIIEVLSDARGMHIETQKRNVDLYGIYFQEIFEPCPRWILELGVRYDQVKFHIKTDRTEAYSYAQGKYSSSPALVTVKKSFHDVSPRFGITYKLSDTFNLYGAIAEGLQTPTEGELDSNPDLDLVSVINYEAGIKARHARWAFDAAAYYSPVENEVIQIVQESGNTEFVNSGKTLRKGIEFLGTVFVTPHLTVGAGYSYTDYTFDTFTEPVRYRGETINLDRGGNTLPLIPQHQYSLSGTFRHPCGFRFRLEALTWGNYYVDNANTEKYDGYELITNAMMGYEKGPMELVLNVNNVFDEHYAVEVQKDTSGAIRYNPAAPLSVMLRLTYRFAE